MGKIYNKETKIFDFVTLKIVPKMSYEYFVNSFTKSTYSKHDFFDNSGFWINIYNIRIENYYYNILLVFRDNVLTNFSIEIFDHFINLEEYDYWKSYSAENENRKKIIHDKWIAEEGVESNDIFTIRSSIDSHNCNAFIGVTYIDNNQDNSINKVKYKELHKKAIKNNPELKEIEREEKINIIKAIIKILFFVAIGGFLFGIIAKYIIQEMIAYFVIIGCFVGFNIFFKYFR